MKIRDDSCFKISYFSPMRYLYQPIDIATLAFFRIVFGVLGFIDVVGTIFHASSRENLSTLAPFHFKYWGFEWAAAPPVWALWGLAICMMVWSVCIALGYYYRLCITLFAFSFTYLFLIEATQYLNHGYLYSMMCFVMIFLPANRCFSLDARRNPTIYSDTTARWHTWILAFMMGVVYFYGGIAKINMDWLNAMPLKMWLKAKHDLFLIGGFISQEWVAWAMSYGGLALDLLAVPLLLFKRTRIFVFLFILFFHFTNTLIFQIGIFPLLSIALTLLYFSPDWPRKMFYRFFKKYKTEEFYDNYQIPPVRQQKWVNGFFIVFIIYHLLMPFRHHLIPQHVAWTEEGHKYSWRMMLRGKSGHGYLLIKDKETGQEWKDFGNDLTKRQKRKMRVHPELVLQYAHYLKKVYQKKGHDVAIYAYLRVGLNGRKKQNFIDSTVDLTKETYPFFGHAHWISPIEW